MISVGTSYWAVQNDTVFSITAYLKTSLRINLSHHILANTFMNLKERWKDKKNIGIIANLLSVYFLSKLMSGAIDFKNDTLSNYFLYGIIIINIILLLRSNRVIKREGKQTKLSIVGKTFALFFALVSICVVYNGNVMLKDLNNIIDFAIAIIITIYIPYSFYLFRNISESIEIPPQQETKITADKLKMPPHAWDK